MASHLLLGDFTFAIPNVPGVRSFPRPVRWQSCPLLSPQCSIPALLSFPALSTNRLFMQYIAQLTFLFYQVCGPHGNEVFDGFWVYLKDWEVNYKIVENFFSKRCFLIPKQMLTLPRVLFNKVGNQTTLSWMFFTSQAYKQKEKKNFNSRENTLVLLGSHWSVVKSLQALRNESSCTASPFKCLKIRSESEQTCSQHVVLFFLVIL